MLRTRIHARLLQIALLLALASCAPGPSNPSFSTTEVDAAQALDAMVKSPVPLARPLVLVGGFGDPGFATSAMYDVLMPTVAESGVHERIKIVTLADCNTFEECRDRIIDAALELETPPTSAATAPVDIVAHSMGGVAARYAAMPADDQTRGKHATTQLAAVRIFTISTPHRGANFADSSFGLETVDDMTIDSPFIRHLNAALPYAPYELVCYTRLGDSMVGVENCAPPGQYAHWVATPMFELPHLSYGDRRVLADIARRLRYEAPLALDPAAPYPKDE